MLTIVVQAGGESLRMGQDKALTPFLGRPLVQRVLERVAGLADELLVTSNHPEALAPFVQYPLVRDLLPGQGALGGLYTALSAASHPLVAVIACDMPFVSAALLEAERVLLDESQADLVVPRTPDGLEPFHSVYRRETCLLPIHFALESGKRRVDSWFDQVTLRYLSIGEILRYDPDQICFRNVNTPAELEEAEQLASRQARKP